MRKLLTLLLLVMGSTGLWAQVTYLPTFSANVGSPGGLNSDSETTTTGWVEVQPPSQSANALSQSEAIGFPFDFFGTPVTHFKASLNGVITFDTATTIIPAANTNLPSPGLPDMSIAGLWDEFTASPPTGTNDRVWRKTFGTPGSQQLWIKWFSFEYGNPNVSFAYFCIVLEEGTNNVYVVDQFSSATPALTRTVGVQMDANTAVQFGDDLIGQEGNGTSLTDNEVWGFAPFLPAPFNTYVISVSSSGADGACNTASESVTIEVGNLGSNPASNIAAAFSVDGGPITAPEIIPGTLNPGDTVSYTFTATADLSVSGPHTIEAGATVLNDADLSNDTLALTVNTGIGVMAPYVEDFETGTTGVPGTFPTGWTMTGGAYIWHVEDDGTTNSSDTGPLDDHTPGGSLYVFTEASSGALGDVTELASPCIDISGLANPSVEFWYHMYGAQMGTLELDVISGGVTTTVFSLSGEQQTNENDPWRQQIVSLGNFSGTIQLVFRGIRGAEFRSDISLDDINVYDQPPVDIAILSVDQPVDPSCLGPNQTVEVTYTNFGSDTLDFAVDTLDFMLDITGPIPAMFTSEVNSGTLAPFDTLTAIITTAADLSAAGIYTLSIDANVNGDTNGSNDSVGVTRERIAPLIPSLPVVDFTGFNSGNLSAIAPGWFEDEGVGNPNGGTTSGWVLDDFANVPANGASAKFNLWNLGDDDWMIGPKFTADTTTFLCYDIALTDFGGTNAVNLGSDDFLKVMISTDCGATYADFFTYDANSTISNVGQTDTFSLASFAGQEIIVAFYASEGTVDDPEDNDIFLDNIFIKKVVQSDITVIDIMGPDPDCGLGAAEPITITVVNFGTDSVSSIDAQFDVNGAGFSAVETLPMGLPAGDTTTFTFTTTVDMTAPGDYVITAVATAATPADQNMLNDSLSATFTSLPVIASYPYLETFENGNGGWLSGGVASSWELGTPANAIISGAFSGTNAWATSLASIYNPDENSFVEGPCFDMTNAPADPWVSLSIWVESEADWDGANLQASLDSGATWINIGANGDPFNWYNDDDIDGLPGGSLEGWSGRNGTGTNGWVYASHPLPDTLVGAPNVHFRVNFGSDGSVQDEGFAFDNFAIGTLPVPDLGPDTINICTGDMLDAGMFSDYEWSTGDSTQSIMLVNTSGAPILDSVIFVTVIDSLGLRGSDSIVVNIAASAPMVMAGVVDSVLCNGDSTGTAMATVTGGTAPYTYTWSNNANMAMTTGLTAGTYNVTVVDSFNCAVDASVTITEPSAITVALDTLIGVACPDDSTGSIMISVSGGTAGYSFSWSNGATTEDLMMLPVGDYTGVITDANGCELTSPTLSIAATDTFPVADFDFVPGDVNYEISFSDMSTDADSVMWDFGDGNTSMDADPTYTFATNDTFIVTLTAINDCGTSTKTDTIIVTNVSIEDDLLSQAVQVYPNPNSGNFDVEFAGINLDKVALRVSNAAGQIIYTRNIGQIRGNYTQEVSLPSTLATGLYILEVRTPDAVMHKRLIIE